MRTCICSLAAAAAAVAPVCWPCHAAFAHVHGHFDWWFFPNNANFILHIRKSCPHADPDNIRTGARSPKPRHSSKRIDFCPSIFVRRIYASPDLQWVGNGDARVRCTTLRVCGAVLSPIDVVSDWVSTAHNSHQRTNELDVITILLALPTRLPFVEENPNASRTGMFTSSDWSFRGGIVEHVITAIIQFFNLQPMRYTFNRCNMSLSRAFGYSAILAVQRQWTG